MKANRIILTLKTDHGDEVRQFTARNLHMTGLQIYFHCLTDGKDYEIPLEHIERIDVFFINVDPVTFEPVISSSNEPA